MAQITTGLTNGGQTAHYAFSYDSALQKTAANPGGPEPARTNAVIAAVEADFGQMTGWFGGTTLSGITFPAPVSVLNAGGGASWNLSSGSLTVSVKPGASGTATDIRYLLVAEMVEVFMLKQNIGWFGAGDEGSSGEGLSRFLSRQFLDSNGLGAPPANFDVANQWLSSSRPDWVNNNDETDIKPNEKSGCATLFLYYLFTQLGFTVPQIVGAGADTLAEVYRNLTGDDADPFPFFKRLLDTAFPGTSTITGGSNLDNPFPLGILSFWVDKSTFGRDEVSDVIASTSHGTFANAFWLVLEGFNIQSFTALGVGTPTLSGAFDALPVIGIGLNPAGRQFEDPSSTTVPQRVRFPFDITFQTGTLNAFPPPGGPAAFRELDAQARIGTTPLAAASAATEFELVGGADPYFTDVDPLAGNEFWLSRDLRVFTATPSLNSHPVAGGPAFATDSFTGAYAYVQNLLAWLNDQNNGFTTGAHDPFTDGTVPQQGAALTGDSSVTPFTLTGFPFTVHRNYNFAIARVRLRGAAGATADGVKVFFRMWSTQSADTDFQPGSTYRSRATGGLPQSPLPATDGHTFPFFATGNAPNLTNPANPEYGASGVNNRSLAITSGDQAFAYFGVFLNVYDPAMTVNGTTVQTLMGGNHHCLVAEIAYDGAPIVNTGGLTMSPANSDKLAQRNLQVTHSDNPGPADTHRVPQTFDVRPSLAAVPAVGDFLDYPDELMIDWGRVPVGATAHIYWPQVDATTVLSLARRLYGSTPLSASDMHTIDAPVTRGVTYVPIPPGTGENYAGLLTIDLPQTVTTGQEFDVVVRRVSTRRARPVVDVDRAPRLQTRDDATARRRSAEDAPNKATAASKTTTKNAANKTTTKAATATKAAAAPTLAAAVPRHVVSARIDARPDEDDATAKARAAALATDRSKGPRSANWRYVTGTFQVKIPVTTSAVMLWPDENTLAIVRWRLTQLAPTDRWHPVLVRYADYLAARIDGLGGDSSSITPSRDGALPQAGAEGERHTHVGRVVDVAFDCYGELEDFTLEACCDGRHTFTAGEPGVRDLVLRALRERLTLAVVTRGAHDARICRIHARV